MFIRISCLNYCNHATGPTAPRLATTIELCDPAKPVFSRMNLLLRRSLVVFLPVLVGTMTVQPLQAKSDLEQVEVSVGRLLEEGHYTHHPLNADVSKKSLK